MPTPKLSEAEARKTVAAVEAMLLKGHRPPGVLSPRDVSAAIVAASDELGVPRGTVEGRLAAAKKHHKLQPDWSLYKPRQKEQERGEPEGPAVDPAKLRLQDENARLKAELKSLHREQMDDNEARQILTGLASAPVEPPDWLVSLQTDKKGASEVPIAQWSDWHYGEQVFKSEVNGINEFNVDIFRRRLRMLVERTIDLCRNHHVVKDGYPGIVVVLGGDMISGHLHPELAENDEGEINDQILEVTGYLLWALRQIADVFGKVYVPAVPGNHGRQYDRKPRTKKYAHRNADWLVYQLLERHLHPRDEMTGERLPGGDDRIQMSIPDTGECLFSVYGLRFMAVHGDDLGVRGGDGIIGAIGPIMRGEIKMRHSQAEIGRDYDILLLGHWHQNLYLKRAIVNNCLKGFDEFARRSLRAVPSAPSQNLFFVHPRRGITARWEVMVEDRPRADAPWVSWEQAA